jgi:cytidyltransferase-like protein
LKRILISGSFDDFRSHHVRLLHEAHRLGKVYVALWSDRMVAAVTGRSPKFPAAERHYLVRTNRYVADVTVAGDIDNPEALPESLLRVVDPDIWLDIEGTQGRAAFCASHGFEYRVLGAGDLAGFPEHDAVADKRGTNPRKKVVVTGCYDWFHSGHVRFFEEASEYGDLYVVVGHDENVRLLKGEGHPHFPQIERRYLVGSVRYVTGAIVSTGSGWMDAEPEILALHPDLYVVNEDGDRAEKRAFCREHNLEYLVLKRTPKDGLMRRSSTNLRDF